MWICRCVSATPSDQIIFCVFSILGCIASSALSFSIMAFVFLFFSICSIDAPNHVFILVQFRLLSTSPGEALTCRFKMQSVATFHGKTCHWRELRTWAFFFPVLCKIHFKPQMSIHYTQSNYHIHALLTTASRKIKTETAYVWVHKKVKSQR